MSTGPAFYDEVGRNYTAHRREDPRIAARIHAALGDAATVRARGLDELRRVARHRVVLLNGETGPVLDFWLVRDYFPGCARLVPDGYSMADACRRLGEARLEPVPVPHDCTDGFLHAYWRRPEAYLDPGMRGAISVFNRLEPAEVQNGVDQLRRDLDDGTWQARHGHLLDLDELDCGYRLVVADVGG